MRSNGTGTGGGKLKVLLAVFDFPMLVVGFRSIIDHELDMEVVAEVDDRDGLEAALARTHADVIVAECLPFATPGCGTYETIELSGPPRRTAGSSPSSVAAAASSSASRSRRAPTAS